MSDSADLIRAARDYPAHVTVIVVVPGQAEPWQVANAAFRLLVDQVRQLEPPADELQLILLGQTYQTLDLTAFEPEQQARVAHLLAESARGLRHGVVSRGDLDGWETELVEALGVLEMWMEGLLDTE